MTDRVVSIELQANATGLVRGAAAAKDAVGELRDEVQSSAMSQRQAWATVGTGLTAIGVATAGVGAAALKTGIQYNTLQQTTRAALTSLLGTAQAANAQMDALDDFARNSPFSKATFISAQQQMLAFGIETKKVVPYLDAVQNAVAAAGGSNQEIEGIVATMAKIQSSAKITAADLNEFGGRGVNAAELIGSQMGKTGAQIRSDITAGSLDATQALDALAKGMTETYAGAADNVKNTFEGSMDRVKAAWRDFSAELAKPLVDPNGGGALVDLLNWAADAMRAFEGLPAPVKNTVTALGGLAGAGALAGGALILGLPKWWEFQRALREIGFSAGNARAGLGSIVRFLGGPWGIALMAAGASVAALNNVISEGRVSQGELSNALRTSATSAEALKKAAETSGVETFFMGDAADQLRELPRLMDDAKEHGTGFWDHVFLARTNNDIAALGTIGRFSDAMAEVSAVDLSSAQRQFADLAKSQNLTNEQTMTLLETMPAFRDALVQQASDAGIAATDANLLAIAMGEIDPVAKTGADAFGELGGAADTAMKSISDLADEILDFGSQQIDAERSVIAFEEQLAALNERVAEGVPGLESSTEAGRENMSSLLDIAEAASQAAAETARAGGSQEEVVGILERGRESLINAAMAYGATRQEAEAYANQLMKTPEEVASELKNNADAAAAAVERYRATLAGVQDSVTTVIRTVMESVDAIADGKAYGGTVGYAHGGTIGGAAYGKTIAGVGGGVAGGTVFGRGGMKSDSVAVRLSRGEEVIQQPYADMYRSELKQMNRGDFVSSPPPVAINAADIQRALGGSGGGMSLTQHIHPNPGMSEAQIGEIAAAKVSWATRGL